MNGSRCRFYLKTKVKGGYLYTLVKFSNHHGKDNMVTRSVPIIGDRVILCHPGTGLVSSFRVVDREHQHITYGSRSWPIGDPEPKMPGLVRFVVEEAEGLFADEVEDK